MKNVGGNYSTATFKLASRFPNKNCHSQKELLVAMDNIILDEFCGYGGDKSDPYFKVWFKLKAYIMSKNTHGKNELNIAKARIECEVFNT